jgi:hypothetical protein
MNLRGSGSERKVDMTAMMFSEMRRRQRASGEGGYIASGRGEGSGRDTDAKAVEELLACSGWAGCVRGCNLGDMRLRHW